MVIVNINTHSSFKKLLWVSITPTYAKDNFNFVSDNEINSHERYIITFNNCNEHMKYKRKLNIY